MLCLMIYYELVKDPAYLDVVICTCQKPIVLARFVCSVILHLSLVEDYTTSLKMMKFANNHPY